MTTEPAEADPSASAMIVVAAGSSRRMGFDKLTARADGVPVLLHTLRAMGACTWLEDIVVVTRRELMTEVETWLADEPESLRRRARMVEGGAERHLSVHKGLQALKAATEWVGIHDGARPLVESAMIRRLFLEARTHGAAALAAPVTDTLKRADETLTVTDSVAREGLWGMQTPQVFRRRLVEEAYRRIQEGRLSVTDEVSALQALNHPVRLLQNEGFNFKVTFPADLRLVEWVLREREAGK